MVKFMRLGCETVETVAVVTLAAGQVRALRSKDASNAGVRCVILDSDMAQSDLRQ